MTDDAKLIERLDTDTLWQMADDLECWFPSHNMERFADAMRDVAKERDGLSARLTALIAENERLQGALALLTVRAGSLVFAHHHGNGLEGWHNVIDGVDRALTKARAALSGDEGGV